MAVHDTAQFSDTIAFNSSGGPGFATVVAAGDPRVARREGRGHQFTATTAVGELTTRQGLMRFEVDRGLLTRDENAELVRFIRARRGLGAAFRFKDWSDHTHTQVGVVGAGAWDPEQEQVFLGTGDGARNTWQLFKLYESGGTYMVRKITRPRRGTTDVKVNGLDVDHSIDHDTGRIFFRNAPAAGQAITAGFQFDVPVRFALETDQEHSARSARPDGVQPDVMSLVEVRDRGEHDEERRFGFADSVWINPDTVNTVDLAIGRWQDFKAAFNGSVFTLRLPDPPDIFDGGPHVFLMRTSFGVSTSIRVELPDTSIAATLTSTDNGAACSLFNGTWKVATL